jgi:aminoglycoside 6-adenylyltransferase
LTEHSFLVAGQNAIVNWASTATGVSAVLLTGSRGRPDESADAYSDLDLLILVTRPPAELAEAIPGIEEAVLVSRQPYGSDEYDLAIVGADFSRLDVTLLRTATTTTVREAVAPVAAAKHLWRGYRVLVDRMLREDHSLPPRPAFDPPDGAALAALAGQFWAQALRAGVFIVRRDLWRAETLLVCRLRSIWLRLAEWDVRLAGEGATTDIWYDGRHIETWAQGPARDALGRLFASYDQRELAMALSAMCTSFARLLERVAPRLHLDTPSDGGVRQHLEALLGRLSRSSEP